MTSKISSVWMRLPEAWRKEITSIAITFLVSYLVALIAAFEGGLPLSITTAGAVAISTLRPLIKPFVLSFIKWLEAKKPVK